MFERFTDRARRSIVLAQEEARRLQHNYIGTEHVLLGLLGEETGVAARAATRFGLTLNVGREDVLAIIGRGKGASSGHIPFTPRAKKCLELALREALQLGHDYIGTEHVLLGIVREGEGVGAQILIQHAGSLSEVRSAVTDLLQGSSTETYRHLLGRLGGRRTATIRPQPEPQPQDVRTTPAADTSLAAAARLAGAGPLGSHHLLAATLDDPTTAAARALLAVGIDLDRAREALRTADVIGSSDELPEEAGRRQMVITVTGDRLTLEATDPEIIELGRAAAKALRTSASPQAGEQTAESGESDSPAESSTAGSSSAEPGPAGPVVVRGDHPLSGSLGLVWQVLHDSLEDIRHRAAAAAKDAGTRAAGEPPRAGKKPAATEKPAAGESEAAPPEESAGG